MTVIVFSINYFHQIPLFIFCGFLIFCLFLNEFLLAYSCFTMLLVSAVPQNESAIHIHVRVCVCVCVCVPSRFGHVQLFETPWTVACQAPLSMGFSRQEYWRGLPCPPPGYLPNPGIKPLSPGLQADSLPMSHQGSLYIYV